MTKGNTRLGWLRRVGLLLSIVVALCVFDRMWRTHWNEYGFTFFLMPVRAEPGFVQFATRVFVFGEAVKQNAVVSRFNGLKVSLLHVYGKLPTMYSSAIWFQKEFADASPGRQWWRLFRARDGRYESPSYEFREKSRASTFVDGGPIETEPVRRAAKSTYDRPAVQSGRFDYDPRSFELGNPRALPPYNEQLADSNQSISSSYIHNGPAASWWPSPEIVSVVFLVTGCFIGLGGWILLDSGLGLFSRLAGFALFEVAAYALLVTGSGLMFFGYWWR